MKKIFAFSLAEALITLLIVALITVASIPVLTKKKRIMDRQGHGTFACYWNGDNLVAKYKMNGIVSNGSVQYDNKEGRYGCVFNPPNGARNFVVTVVGGGGGGTAGYHKFNRNTYSVGSTSFEIPATGLYDAIVIGGGGGGGSSKLRCSDPDCGGGASSAAITGFREVKFIKGDVLSFSIGGGGASHSGKLERGEKGGDSTITLRRDGVSETLLKAGGGGGGYGKRRSTITGMFYWGGGMTEKDHYDDYHFHDDETDNYPSSKAYAMAAGESSVSSSKIPSDKRIISHGTRRARTISLTNCEKGSSNSWCYNKKYNTYKSEFGYDSSSNSNMYGSGGRGDRDGGAGPNSGKPGIGVLQWNQGFGGLGGKAGNVLQLPFAQLPVKTMAFPGKGGKGGVANGNRQGQPGQSSYLKNYAEVTPGGPSININVNDSNTYSGSSSADGYVKGGNGDTANINPTDKSSGGAGAFSTVDDNGYINNESVNGHTRPIFKNGVEISEFKNLVGAGAGGGGGSSDGKTSGNGGDGSSGVVFIQW